MSGYKRLNIPAKVRWQVFARDGFRCRYCGVPGGDAVLVVDHDLAVSLGGKNEEWNLITACETCNQGKGASRSICLDDLRSRDATLEMIWGWLDQTWEDASGLPPVMEGGYGYLLSCAGSYAEAEAILRRVGMAYRDGYLRRGLSRLDLINLIACYGHFVESIGDWAELTHGEQRQLHREFWGDPDWHLGVVESVPGEFGA